MSSSESIATPSRPTSPSERGWSESQAHERRHVERRRQAGLPVLQQVPEALVRFLGPAEAGELAHRPELAAVHRRVDAARERIDARVAEVALVVDVDAVRRVERFVLEARDRREELALTLGLRVVELALPLAGRVVRPRARILCRGHLRSILRTRFPLLLSAPSADIRPVEKIVAVVICGLVALSAAGGPAAATNRDDLLRKASHLSGLPVRRVVPQKLLPGARYDAALSARRRPRISAVAPEYRHRSVRTARLDAPQSASEPHGRRPCVTRVVRPVGSPAPPPADADGAEGVGRQRARPRARRPELQPPADRPTACARPRPRARREEHRGRDRRTRFGCECSPVRGAPLERFLQLESGLAAGKTLAKELRYLGGSPALASALRLFPQTTEQLLHVDKFLERERALPVRLPTRIGDWKLSASETFGELDVRSLLRAFNVPNALAAAEGWGGGRVGLYVSPTGQTTAALALQWDTIDDAEEWRAAVTRLHRSGFPRRDRTRLPAARPLLVELVGRRRRSARQRQRLRERTGIRHDRGSALRAEVTLDSRLRVVRSAAGQARLRDALQSGCCDRPGEGFMSFQYPRGGICAKSAPLKPTKRSLSPAAKADSSIGATCSKSARGWRKMASFPDLRPHRSLGKSRA